MHNPFAWSFPIGRLFGVEIRIHILFPLVALGLILRAATQDGVPPGTWVDATVLLGLLFFSVLCHEFGHCFAARSVGGDAEKVLLWPLGGLANCEVPHNPRAHFITAMWGPLVNVILGVSALVVLFAFYNIQPHFGFRYIGREFSGWFHLSEWGGGETGRLSPFSPQVLLHQFFWVNYFGFLFNIILVGFPMDSGRMLQATAWKYVGHHRGTLIAIYAGYVTMLIVGLGAIIANEVLFLALALFIYFQCYQEQRMLEIGREESLFGYDFSQGYTSLERDDEKEETRVRPKRKGWIQTWKEKRERKRREKDEAQKRADEERLDQLLEKINQEGADSLTEEERRFMMRVSDEYRNRHQ